MLILSAWPGGDSTDGADALRAGGTETINRSLGGSGLTLVALGLAVSASARAITTTFSFLQP